MQIRGEKRWDLHLHIYIALLYMCNKGACVRGCQKPRKIAIDGLRNRQFNNFITGFFCLFQEFKMGENKLGIGKMRNGNDDDDCAFSTVIQSADPPSSMT